MHRFIPNLLTAGAISLAMAASAFAQSPPAMPMPPSARDPLPKEAAPATSKPASKAKKRARSDAVTPARTRGGDESLSERIDTRPARGGGIELENDPRAVQPTMQNGRAGVGMRF